MSQVKYGFTAQQLVDEGRVNWEDINLLKDWMFGEDLPNMTNEQIVILLLSFGNDQEVTRKTMKSLSYLATKPPQLLYNRSMKHEDIQKQARTFQFCVLPEKTSDDCAVVLCRLNDTVYYNVDMEPAIKLCSMVMEAVVHEYPPKGIVVLIDMKGTGLMHLTRIRIGLIRMLLRCVSDVSPTQLLTIHVFNTVYFIDKLLAFVKPFINSEVIEAVHFHQPNMDMESFYENHLPKQYLPEDYGGDLPSVEILHERTIQKLIDMEPHFEAEELQLRDTYF